MSSVTETNAEEADQCCAFCGVAPVDDIKLKECNGGCDLVKYCSDRCQELHRPEHVGVCKKRKAELRDRELFEQPDGTYLGECPLCFLPMPLDLKKSTFCSGCCKLVCDGCVYANYLSSGNTNCPFCREPGVKGEEENRKRLMKRVKVNDPAALRQMGLLSYDDRDYDRAFEYFRKAAELGDAAAHNKLGCMYFKGEGVEKDEENAIHHYEKAAIGGHPKARHNLGAVEGSNGNTERAAKHFIIAAKLGFDESMKKLWRHFQLDTSPKRN